MKRKPAYIVILFTVYFLGISQPLIPFLDYLVNFDFIVENICEQRDEIENLCMGKCYLNNQIIEKILEKETNPEQKESQINIQMLAFHLIEEAAEGKEKIVISKYNSPYIFNNIQASIKPNIPPPKVV